MLIIPSFTKRESGLGIKIKYSKMSTPKNTMERVLDLQEYGIDDYSGYTGPILKIPSL